MYILGFSGCAGCHDSSAALLKDNVVVAMVEQERLSRRRHAHGEWPIEAIRYCLHSAQISLQDVAYVAYPWNTRLSAAESASTLDLRPAADDLRPLIVELTDGDMASFPQVHYVSHHVAHFANAYWLSGYSEAAGLVVDGRGEREATTLFYACDATYKVLKQYSFLHSLGALYDAATECSGLDGNDAGKFMGLSAYGRPIRQIPISYEDGYRLFVSPQAQKETDESWTLQYRFLRTYMAEVNYPYQLGARENMMDYADLACSVQAALERAMLSLSALLREMTGSERLVISGGVGLNCTANTTVANRSGFGEVFIAPTANDGGVALGAALDLARYLGLLERGVAQAPLRDVYWGPGYADDEIAAALRRYGMDARYRTDSEQLDLLATWLTRGALAGWFKGRAEVGPRALGARSILASPADRVTLNRLNKLKGRELWRPLAPSILAESYDEFFEGAPPSRFMLQTASVREHQRRRIPAVTHVDGTARPQIVEADTNPEFYHLIQRFGQLTGLPLVVNTSFNLFGTPIVNTPDEAIESFLTSDLDVLAIGSFLVVKPQSISRRDNTAS